MRPVVVERRYRFPVTLQQIEAADAAAQWCIEANGARAVLHAIGDTGRRSICIYEAPDAEALRRVHGLIAPDLPVDIWPCIEHRTGRQPSADDGLPEPGRAYALLDRRLPRAEESDEREASVRGDRATLRLHPVQSLAAYRSLDGRRELCLYTAPDRCSIAVALQGEVLPVLLR